MTIATAAWVCLLAPLARRAADHARGRTPFAARRRVPRDALDVDRVRRSARRVRRDARRGQRGAQSRHHGVDLAQGRRLRGGPQPPRRPAEHADDADRLRGRLADRRVLDRLHGRGGRGAPLLRVHGVLRLLDAAPRRGREPRAPARGLGPRRPGVVPADRLPPRPPVRDRRGEEGLRDERDRRRDDGARDLPALLEDRRRRLRRRVRARRRALEHGRHARRARASRRGGREVGAAPAADVAPGRDGRPDAGQRPHPRGDDGDGGRLPARPAAPDLRGRRVRAATRCGDRRGHAARRGADRARADGHQARDRVLDDVADRLHVPGRRDRRVRQRDVPPDDARLLQGAAVPRRRNRDPRARRRAGHSQDGRAARRAAAHLPVHADRLARARGDLPVVGLLVEGRDPRLCARERRVRDRALRRGLDRRVPDRPLHVPDDLPRVARRPLAVRARAPARHEPRRSPVLDVRRRRGARGALRRRRLAPGGRDLAPLLRLAAPGRRAARRAERAAGLGDVGGRDDARPRRDLPGVALLRAEERSGSELPHGQARCSSTSSTSTSSTTRSSTAPRSHSRRRCAAVSSSRWSRARSTLPLPASGKPAEPRR